MLSKKIIFLTGATGTMGEEGLKQILSRSDRFNLRVLVRPSAKNKAFMSRYEHDAALEIVWGDLCCYDDILRCVTGADYVLHVGAFVSPEADKLPQRSLEAVSYTHLDVYKRQVSMELCPSTSASFAISR